MNSPETIVPCASTFETPSFPLFLPHVVMDTYTDQDFFLYLCQTWLFTAWLRKRFPQASVLEATMVAGMAAWRSVPEMLELNRRALGFCKPHLRAKAEIITKMLEELKRSFLDSSLATMPKEDAVEVMGYLHKAASEVAGTLFPEDPIVVFCPRHGVEVAPARAANRADFN